MTFYLREPTEGPFWLPDFTRSITDALDTLDRRGHVALDASEPLKVVQAVALVDASAGAVTVTLPAVRDAMGQVFNVKKIDASGNAVVLSGDATIDGGASVSMTTQWDSTTVYSDGEGWFVL